MTERKPVPRPLIALAAASLACGLLALVLSWRLEPPYLSLPLVVLALATLLTENFALNIPGGSISLAYPLTVAAFVLQGPASGCVVAALSAVTVQDVRRRFPLSVMAFNVGQLLLITSAGGWAFHLVSGRPAGATMPTSFGADFSAVGIDFVAVAAAGIVCAVGNVVLTSLGMWAASGGRVSDYLQQNAWAIPSQVALAFMGYLIALILDISVPGFLLFVFPLAVARQLYINYQRTRDAYVDTVRALVGAVEAKDSYTRGHSERVAMLAVELGRAAGLTAPQLRRLHYSALLHDVGKLGVSHEILSKPGKLTSDEFQAIQKHSEYGWAMVQRIPALADLAPVILAHHEKYDGGGYPGGVSGDRIPRLARILCVVDAYDAMTTARSYRRAMSCESACEEIRRCAGTQFDARLALLFVDQVIPSVAGEEPANVEAVPEPARAV